MTREIAAYRAYARANLAIKLGNDAGRNAYLAAFQPAQAFIFDRMGKVAKTHQACIPAYPTGKGRTSY